MMACATLGYLLSLSQFTPIKPLKSKRQLWKICLLSSIFCVTIVLGNLSLKYIPVSFNQAIGATTPFFTAIFAVLLQGAPGAKAAWHSRWHGSCSTQQQQQQQQ
jgi:drug/metabolite transporter (DMT)-like permease